MHPHRRLPRTLDGALVAGLSRKPATTARARTFEWRKVRNRGRATVRWHAWVASGAAHLLVFIALSVSITMVDPSNVRTLLAELSTEPQEVALRTSDAGPELTAELQVEMEAAVLIECPDFLDRPVDGDPEPIDLEPVELREDDGLKLPAGRGLAEPFVESKEIARPEKPTARQGDGANGEGPPAAKYFGTIASGDRFVYVLDRSTSMDATTGKHNTSRFDRARAELLRSVEQLDQDQSFYVVLFSSGMQRMFDDDTAVPEMLRATQDNKARLRKWMLSVGTAGGTEPAEAIRFALSLRPSAVFMLSDGEFNGTPVAGNGNMFQADPKIAKLLGRDRHGSTPIHTFAYEDPRSRGNMEALASATGGRYRYIAPGEAAKFAAVPQPAAPQPAVPQPAAPPVMQPREGLRPPAALLASGDQLRDAGEYGQALQAYRDLIRKYPVTSAASTARGRIIQIGTRMRRQR